MSRERAAAKPSFLSFIGVMLLLACTAPSAGPQDEPARPKPHGMLANSFQAPISFEPNLGQTDGRVRFMARGSGYNLFLTPSNAVFSFQSAAADPQLAPKESHAVIMSVVGANPVAQIGARDELPGRSSYFLGTDRKHWHTDIPTFGRVQYDNIYPGIDLVYHGIQGQLEYDFVVHPGAQPAVIALEFKGARRIKVTSLGELVLDAAHGQMYFHKPVAYQQHGESKHSVEVRYVLTRQNHVGFALGAYDSRETLIIDPVLAYPSLKGRRTRSF